MIVSQMEPLFLPLLCFSPRWQVSRSKGKYGAVANLKIEADTDIDGLVVRVWGAYRKFGAFDYLPDEVKEPSPQPKIESRRELAPEVYPNAVECALEAIKEGAYEKGRAGAQYRIARGSPMAAAQCLEPPAGTFRGLLHFFFSGDTSSSFHWGDARSVCFR